jgi:hypothetical protein
MIWIVDNGRDYSDHQIYFVATDAEWQERFLQRFLALPRLVGVHSAPYVIGAAERVDWHEGNAMTLTRFVGEFDGWFFDEGDGPNAVAIYRSIVEDWTSHGMAVGKLPWSLVSSAK